MKTEAFDKKLKQKLETRRISPSDSGWEKLTARLDSKEKKSQKSMWWIGIAAVFLIGFFVGGLVFKPEKKAANNPQLVNETPEKQREKAVEKMQQPETISLKKITKAEVAVTAEKVSENNPAPKFSAEPNTTTTDKFPQKNKTIVSEISLETPETMKKEADKIFQKLIKKTDLSAITDAEIESLLEKARLEIAEQQFFEQPKSYTVSAQALLESVEKELNSSYREKLFKLVEDKLVRLAAANNPFQ